VKPKPRRPLDHPSILDAHIVAKHRACRSQLRRPETPKAFKAKLRHVILPELEAEAERRGITEQLPGRRAFIAKDKTNGGGLRFGFTTAAEGPELIERLPPHAKFGKAKRPLPAPPASSAGEMFDAVEAGVAAAMRSAA
jgi:hypothetical protein